MNECPVDEDMLIAKAQNGDDSAFMILIQTYKPRILGMASRFGRDTEEVRDLAQEISLELWRAIRSFNRIAPFEHWLSRVATNRCLRFLRRNYRRRSMVVANVATEEGCDRAEEMVDQTTSRNQEAAEARELLALAMARLSAKDALVITLKDIEGHSVADIARDTGWSVATVKVRAHRARERLRKILEDLGEF
jgi:RNA polymerase sigma-70 factor, ECF subfamily